MSITKKNFLIVWIFGLSSGFTIMISSYTLNYWLSAEQIDIRTIGIFSLISIPYAINFIWAPMFDTKNIPILSSIFGSRLSWVLVIQILLSSSIYLMSLFDPLEELVQIAITSFLVSFFASAQDSVLGAMRTELIPKNKQGEISGMYIFGYRIGMLISSSGAIYISQFLKWNLIYELFSVIVIVFSITLIILFYGHNFQEKPKLNDELLDNSKSRVYILITKILKPVGSGSYIFLVLLFLVLYRLPDNFINVMLTPFLHHIGYGALEISTAGKLFGAISAMVGGLIASYIMKKRTIYSSLLIFGFVHAIAHMLYIFQEIYGKNIYILFVITAFEGTSGGMTMAAYIAFIASLCEGKFRATQYSFFSSMMGFSRSIFPSISGYMVLNFGWVTFYICTTIATFPALIMIFYLNKRIKNQSSNLQEE